MNLDAVIEYRDGRYLGELEFLGLSSVRPVSVRAQTFVEIASLHPKDIEDIVRDCAPLRARLRKYAGLKDKLEELRQQKGVNGVSVVDAEMLLQEAAQTAVPLNGADDDDDGDRTIESLMHDDPSWSLGQGTEGGGSGDIGHGAKIMRKLDQLIASNAELAAGQAELSSRLANVEAKVR